jgi:hypothetical protein
MGYFTKKAEEHWTLLTSQNTPQMRNIRAVSVANVEQGSGVGWGGVELGPLDPAATGGSIVGAPDHIWAWNISWNENWQGKPMYQEKILLSATFSTINPTWSDVWTRVTTAGSRRLTAWATLPCGDLHYCVSESVSASYGHCFSRLNTGIVGWNPTRGMEPRFF